MPELYSGSGFGVWLTLWRPPGKKSISEIFGRFLFYLFLLFFILLRFSQYVACQLRLIVLFICVAKWNEILYNDDDDDNDDDDGDGDWC